MTKGTIDYSKGRIYQIVNDVDDEVYVGSTCDKLANRLHGHRSHINSKRFENIRLYQHMRNIGVEHFRVELIEYYPCETKDELHAREGQFIRERGTLNGRIEGRTLTQYYEDNKEVIAEKTKQYYESNKEVLVEKAKQYREAHKNEIVEKKKQYYETHKEEIAKRDKQYYETHKDKFAEKNKKYREAHKEEIAERDRLYREAHKKVLAERRGRIFECPCGCRFTICNKSRHLKSKKHIAYEAKQKEQTE
jgi:hypothetical protein